MCAHPASEFCFAAARRRPRPASSRCDLTRAKPRSCANRTTLPMTLRFSRYFTRAEAIEFPTTGGKTAFGLYYPADQSRFQHARRREASAACEVPWRADLRCIQHSQPGHPILDQPRHRRARRELRRQHRLWPRVPRAARRPTGASSTWTTASMARAISPSRDSSTASAASSRAAAPAATPTLSALTFRDYFRGGASYYGVSDLAALARDTHKFESRYLDGLIGPYPREGSALSRALADLSRRTAVRPGDLLPGRGGQGGAAEPGRD